MKLITVVSVIRRSSRYVDLMVRVDLNAERSRDADDPTLVAQELPFTWVRGDPHGLGPQIDEWMLGHPELLGG